MTGVELIDYWVALRRHWRAFAAILAAGLVLAGLVTLLMPKVYTSAASGLVSVGSTDGLAQASIGDTLAKSRAKSYLDVAKSKAVAERVVADLQLPTTAAGVIGQVTITQPTDTVLINVSANGSTPEAASQLADAWVRALAAQVAAIENPDGTKANALRVVPVEAAAVPSSPSSPRPAVNLALGALLGALLGLGYVVVASRLDHRLRTPEDITRAFDVTIAGVVPMSEELARTPDGLLPLAVSPDHVSSNAAESLRKLRTNLRFMHIDKPPRVIVVTSPLPGDGKSTVAGNLAAALAVGGTPTILVDADLRRPTLATSFALDSSFGGLSNLLVGDADVLDVAQKSLVSPNLLLLSAGSIPPNPSEMLGSAAMKKLLSALADNYVIILDSPPLLPVTDAAVLTANADGALIVVSEGKTTDTELGGALAQLEAVSGTVLGVIINKVSKAAGSSSYYNGYYGYYGHTYGESAKESAKASDSGPVNGGRFALATPAE